MSKFKYILVIIIASICANVYFFKKDGGNGGAPGVPPVPTDEPVVMRTSGGLLEVSGINRVEQFQSSVSHSVLGVPTGQTITAIRVPAVYRYHIQLALEWKIRLKDKTFIVIAPPVKPTLPVAINTAGIQMQSFGVWSIFYGNSMLNQLQLSITPALAVKAASPGYVNFQRETARKTVTEFVAKWLITQDKWKSASAYPIRVFFSDEPIQALGM